MTDEHHERGGRGPDTPPNATSSGEPPAAIVVIDDREPTLTRFCLTFAEWHDVGAAIAGGLGALEAYAAEFSHSVALECARDLEAAGKVLADAEVRP